MAGRSILIVDDEAPIREMIAVALEMAGYDCIEAENSQQAHAIIVDRKPDLILLDWMLPGTSGIELARRLKRDELTGDIPIIMLTAKGEEDNKIQGLEVGADDYITKPFSPRELVARLKAVLRRAGPTDGEAPIEVGGLLLDPISHRVTIDGKPAEMGPTEYRLLRQQTQRLWAYCLSDQTTPRQTVPRTHALPVTVVHSRHGLARTPQAGHGVQRPKQVFAHTPTLPSLG